MLPSYWKNEKVNFQPLDSIVRFYISRRNTHLLRMRRILSPFFRNVSNMVKPVFIEWSIRYILVITRALQLPHSCNLIGRSYMDLYKRACVSQDKLSFFTQWKLSHAQIFIRRWSICCTAFTYASHHQACWLFLLNCTIIVGISYELTTDMIIQNCSKTCIRKTL